MPGEFGHEGVCLLAAMGSLDGRLDEDRGVSNERPPVVMLLECGTLKHKAMQAAFLAAVYISGDAKLLPTAYWAEIVRIR